MTVADEFALQMKAFRSQREWTQNRLATRLGELGSTLGRGTLAKIECGSRQVLLNDAVEIAAALDVSLVRMLVPTDREATVAVAPKMPATAREVRRWIEGWAPLPGANDQAWFANLPREEWLIYRNSLVGDIIRRLEKFADDAASEDGATREEADTELNNFLADLHSRYRLPPSNARALPPRKTTKKPKPVQRRRQT